MKNKNVRILFFVNISEHTQYFRIRIFAIGSFLIENRINFKKILKFFFFQIHLIFFGVIFQRFFPDFSVSFQYFLEHVSALKFPLTATEYYAYKGVPSVESKQLLTIIEAIKETTEEGQNAQLYLRYRGSNQIMIFIDCNHIKGSFDSESL